MKRLKNLIIPILCVAVLLLFAGRPLKEANAKPLGQATTAADSNSRINQHEISILNRLTESINLTGDRNQRRGEAEADYESFLMQYLNSEGTDLSAREEEQVALKAEELKELLSFEGKKNLGELSADGREVAIGLTREVFSACGLKAGVNPLGELISLEGTSGSITLIEDSEQHINAGVLLIAITVVGVLLTICYVLSKKSRILIKDVKYDGFHKEEFAR